jgi:preprotein translocase subunit SecD
MNLKGSNPSSSSMGSRRGYSLTAPKPLRFQLETRLCAWCLMVGGLAGAGGWSLGCGPVRAQSGYSTELRLAVDPGAPEAKKVGRAEEKLMQPALEKRLPILAVTGGRVEVRTADDILVRIPAEKVSEPQLRMFRRRGLLEFRNLDDVHTSLNPRGRYLLDLLRVQKTSVIRFQERETGRVHQAAEILRRSPLLLDNRDLIAGAARVVTQGHFAVRVQVTREAGKRLERFTSKPGRLLAVALDGEIIGLHALTKDLGRGAEGEDGKKGLMDLDITGGFTTEQEARFLATVFNSGPLPCPLTVVSSKLVGE